MTARTYYNPIGTILIVFLGSLIAVTGILSSKWRHIGKDSLLKGRLVTKMRRLFPYILASTLFTLSADASITLYAVSTYGTSIEANRVVAALIERGAVVEWLGQHFTPIFIVSLLFYLSRNAYIKIMATFYTLGTLGYGLITVANNLHILYTLSR